MNSQLKALVLVISAFVIISCLGMIPGLVVSSDFRCKSGYGNISGFIMNPVLVLISVLISISALTISVFGITSVLVMISGFETISVFYIISSF